MRAFGRVSQSEPWLQRRSAVLAPHLPIGLQERMLRSTSPRNLTWLSIGTNVRAAPLRTSSKRTISSCTCAGVRSARTFLAEASGSADALDLGSDGTGRWKMHRAAQTENGYVPTTCRKWRKLRLLSSYIDCGLCSYWTIGKKRDGLKMLFQPEPPLGPQRSWLVAQISAGSTIFNIYSIRGI